ncbi:hypothetical protein [Burkholderia sola]|uniref:hypothetical protein n=1 Tax=Burkholderia sola TaxID=2843302 RepID=UPI0023DDCC9E|nr:hypothetical protein [Burkholderia sola]MDF3080327.1 hypothetical protein [Burkholderia sola]
MLYTATADAMTATRRLRLFFIDAEGVGWSWDGLPTILSQWRCVTQSIRHRPLVYAASRMQPVAPHGGIVATVSSRSIDPVALKNVEEFAEEPAVCSTASAHRYSWKSMGSETPCRSTRTTMRPELFGAVCSRTTINTDVDVLAIPYAAADLIGPVMDKPIRLDRDALPLGHAGACSSFLRFVTRAEAKCGMPACDIPVEQDPSAVAGSP